MQVIVLGTLQIVAAMNTAAAAAATIAGQVVRAKADMQADKNR